MDVDLTCPECEGGAKRPMSTDFYERCMLCRGEGRRLPELREWDVLRAERDRYREVLEFVSDYCDDDATVAVVDNALRQGTALANYDVSKWIGKQRRKKGSE